MTKRTSLVEASSVAHALEAERAAKGFAPAKPVRAAAPKPEAMTRERVVMQAQGVALPSETWRKLRRLAAMRALATDTRASASAIVAEVVAEALPAIERELAELAAAELEGEAGAV